MRPILKKVQAIKKWQSLVTTKGVNSFLELVNFYKKFITFFSTLGKPFMDLLKWSCHLNGKTNNKMFKKLKEKVSTTLMLKFLDFSKLFEIHINANEFTIGGVLMEDGHPITLEGKKLTRAQLKKEIHEKKLFIVLNCLKTYQHYLGL